MAVVVQSLGARSLLTCGSPRRDPCQAPDGAVYSECSSNEIGTVGGTGYQLDGTDNRDPILGIIVINPTLEFNPAVIKADGKFVML
jgi:hypothetical protein